MSARTIPSAPPASSSGGVSAAAALAVPYVVLLLFTLPILVLNVWLGYSSFFPRMEGLKPVGGFTLENWRFLWDPASVEQLSNKPTVIPLTINTFVFSLATTGVVLLISSMAGYALSRLRFARIGKLPGVRGVYGYLDAHALASRRCGSTANYLRDRLGTVLRLVPARAICTSGSGPPSGCLPMAWTTWRISSTASTPRWICGRWMLTRRTGRIDCAGRWRSAQTW